MNKKDQDFMNYVNNYEKELEARFRKIDLSGDGFISFGEFVKLMNSFGYPLSEQELKRSFALYDENRDGKISLKGFLNIQLNLIKTKFIDYFFIP